MSLNSFKHFYSEITHDETYNESVLFSKRNLYVRLEDFTTGDENILLITGFSGSGKSTYAAALAETIKENYKHKVEVIPLDGIGWFLAGKVTLEKIKGAIPSLYEFYEKNTDYWNQYTKEWTTLNEYSLVYKYIPWLFEWCKKQPKTKFIIEGIQIYEYFITGEKQVPPFPIIIMGTSCVKSTYRALKRGELKLKDSFYHLKWLMKDNKWINQFVKAIHDYYKENTEDFEEEDYITEAYDLIQPVSKEIIPMFFVTTFTYTQFGKIVRGITNATYSHSAIGFNPDLSELYSFNAGFGGLSKESIEGYLGDSQDAEIYVGMVLLKRNEYKQAVDTINEYIRNEDKTSYAFRNLFNMAFHVPSSNKNQFSMVCSQFVDMIFKKTNIDLSGKNSSLTTPQDLRNSNNIRVYTIYEGLAKEYDSKKTNRIIGSLQGHIKRGQSLKFIGESTDNLNNLKAVFESSISTNGIKNIIFDFGSVLVENISGELQVFSYTEEMLKFLRQKGYKLYYLSNWDKRSFENFKKKGIFSYMKYFEDGIVSYEVGLEKPAKSIYEMLLEKCNLVAEECIFFDDKPENIKAANEVGIHGIVFNQKTVKEIFDMKSPSQSIKENAYDELLERELQNCSFTATESLIFSKDNLELNLDNWKPGKALWITGSSGDGKSTLAKKMASEKNAVIITTDIVLLKMAKTPQKFKSIIKEFDKKSVGTEIGIQLSFEFIKAHPELPDSIGYHNPDLMKDGFQKFFDFLMTSMEVDKRLNDKYVIIEGCDISFMNPEILVRQPLIIMGTSRLQGFIRRFHRETNEEYDPLRDKEQVSTLKIILKLIRKYREYGKDLDDRKDRLWKDISKLSKEVFSESVEDTNKKCFEDLKHYVQWCRMDDSLFLNIEPLKDPIVHTTKKGEKWLLLATMSGSDDQKKKLLNFLSDNVRYNGEKIEFHGCYLPGDIFAYVEIPSDVKESVEVSFTEKEKKFLNCLEGPSMFTESVTDSKREKLLNLVVKKLEEKGKTPKISSPDKKSWISEGKSKDFGPSLCIAGLGNEGLNQVCSDVNLVIKDMGGKLHPDNYGTAFLTIKESGQEDVFEESYIGNYFRNKVLLKRFAQKPELNRKLCIEVIENLEKRFKVVEKTKQVKEIKDTEDAEHYFFSVSSLEFPDGVTITIAFCFNYKSFTPGAACYTSEMGYVVVIYPIYFEENLESKIFILLHEIGHIRLNHTDSNNQSWWDPNRRVHVMKKGKVIYPEANADLYAVLNGSKMYTILQAGVSDDYDKDYDYRFTNSEMAQRYAKVMKGYGKLRGFGKEALESCQDFVLESDNSPKKQYKIEKEYGIRGPEGLYNACVKVKGLNKPLRARSEILVIKGDSVFVQFKDGDKYDIPGGSWEENEGHKTSAVRECMEEARIECKNVEYIDTYVEVFDEPKQWVKDKFDKKDWWYGYYTELYVGEYDKKFTGHVDELDKDNVMIKKGKFYPIKEVYSKLKPVHQEAIVEYFKVINKNIVLESTEEYTPIGSDEWDIFESLFEAVEANTYIIRDEIYPTIEEVLSTPAGDKLYRRAIESFVDRNTERLHEVCPISMIAFTDSDKAKFFDIFGLDQKQTVKIIEKALTAISGNAQFRLVKQNPIFTVFYCALRYYTLKGDESGVNATLIIHALSSYPSIFSKYFQYGANASIMQYTADHLTEKFIFKQEGHVFGALRKSIESGYQFLKPFIKDGSDKEVVRFIQRVRNDQNSIMKKIKNEYNKNRASGKYTTTQLDTYDNGALIDDFSNDTSQVETIAQKIIINILTNGIDLKALETAANIAQLSVVELRYYLTKIMVDSKSAELDSFITSVLFIYLFDEKHKKEEIRSKVFIVFGIELFRRTNSNNKNVVVIKELLNKWSEETGIHTKFRREATRIAYKKGIFWYIMLSIQMMS